MRVRFGDPEINDAGSDSGKQDVGWFEIAVNDACGMNGGECGGDAYSEACEVGTGEGAGVGDGFGEGGAGDVLGDHIEGRPVERGVKHRGCTERADPAGGVDFPAKALVKDGIASESGVNDLDRYLLGLLVLGEVHRSHAALAQAGEDAVGAEPLRVLFVQRLGHVHLRGGRGSGLMEKHTTGDDRVGRGERQVF